MPQPFSADLRERVLVALSQVMAEARKMPAPHGDAYATGLPNRITRRSSALLKRVTPSV